MTQKQKVILFFATGAATGNAPFAPGTIGTMAGLPLCFLLSVLHPALSGIGAIMFITFAIWTANQAEQIIGLKDPGRIVIDEMAGIIVTLLWLPFTGKIIIWGFLLFRIFDIVKPFPIRQLERKISGGLGIVVDDLIAGILAQAVIRIVLFFL